jgi:hypothetical protein
VSKEKFTVLFCGNMVGEMEKPLVIKEIAKPKCFKNLIIINLPVIYRSPRPDTRIA